MKAEQWPTWTWAGRKVEQWPTWGGAGTIGDLEQEYEEQVQRERAEDCVEIICRDGEMAEVTIQGRPAVLTVALIKTLSALICSEVKDGRVEELVDTLCEYLRELCDVPKGK